MKKRSYKRQFNIVGLLLVAAFSFMAFSARTDAVIRTLSISNDPFSDTQWYIDNTGKYSDFSEVMKRYSQSTADVDMNITEAWEEMEQQNIAGREVVVAIIDTGVDYTHPDLAEHMWVNKGEIPDDNIDNDNNGYVDDIYGWDFYHNDNTVCHYMYSERYHMDVADPLDNDNHGTHIAGTIAAIANNNAGIAGIASNINIKIMSLKINGGKEGTGETLDAVEAIQYASRMGADICNISWGTTKYDSRLEEAIKESGMLFVAAAGNDGIDIDQHPLYPASFVLDNLISVTFIDADGDLTGYSNYGKNSVDIAAPGDHILSTVVGSYSTMSGSSMAAPQISAVAALLYAYNDHLYASNIKEILINNLKSINGLEKVTKYGGIPNAYASVLAADQLIRDTKAPSLSFHTGYDKDKMIVKIQAKDSGESGIRTIRWIYGSRKKSDFLKGTSGTIVKENQVELTKAGVYTFYATDYAGNETIQTYRVKEDTTAPKVTAMFTVTDDYKYRKVTVIASDKQGGVRRVEYMKGRHKAEEFLPADSGNIIGIINGKGQFRIEKDGLYSVFAIDYRGNMTVKEILVKTVKAKKLNFAYDDKELFVDDVIQLITHVYPVDSTDAVTYSSSDERIVRISPTGKATALKAGTVIIVAKTTSGRSASCLITVKLKE